jgi:hypothetical protein
MTSREETHAADPKSWAGLVEVVTLYHLMLFNHAKGSDMQLMNSTPLTSLGIPQDILDQAHKVGMDAEELVKLCVAHTTDAARSWLRWLEKKLGK